MTKEALSRGDATEGDIGQTNYQRDDSCLPESVSLDGSLNYGVSFADGFVDEMWAGGLTDDENMKNEVLYSVGPTSKACAVRTLKKIVSHCIQTPHRHRYAHLRRSPPVNCPPKPTLVDVNRCWPTLI
jgi:hypothetical protein